MTRNDQFRHILFHPLHPVQYRDHTHKVSAHSSYKQTYFYSTKHPQKDPENSPPIFFSSDLPQTL